ncbi:WxL domain-containing protein [Candidatus Enterococcus murrayae]|uniref:WxL domain-containing protein n=1 Tax=Candidatus Enterococcus murrayae TaxID=2815321 RepID=A0ABS3HCZ6_9ENTE|nr:WxL domain-containing protein [Enterococcus sp. MJM16]MBO0451326.1 WxL domain-containing protein [Enterococcus sp. MJM16]
MNKKKLVTGLLSAAFLGGVLVTTALPADAATYGKQSTGSVTFKKGQLVTPPITPPITPPVTPPPGTDFGLLYVPKEFNFAETTVPTTVVTSTTVVPIGTNWEGSPATETGSPVGSNPTTKHFGVGDVRGKRASGWKLEAKLTDDLAVSPTKKLDGATITMKQGINELTPTTAPAPWISTATTPGATANTPDVVTGFAAGTQVSLSTTSTLIMSADEESGPGNADGRGEGYWEGEFTNIELNIPAAAMNKVLDGEQYSGTIDWTLTDSI